MCLIKIAQCCSAEIAGIRWNHDVLFANIPCFSAPKITNHSPLAQPPDSKQYLNHLDGLQCIGRKNELYFNLKSYCEREKIDVHAMAPPTFIVSAGEACTEYHEFARICKAMDNKNRAGAFRTPPPPIYIFTYIYTCTYMQLNNRYVYVYM